MALHYGECCHPLPGDQIVGIAISGLGATIHIITCDALKEYAEEPERWLDVTWDNQDGQSYYTGRLFLMAANSPKTIEAMTNAISKGHANIVNLKMTHKSDLFIECVIDLEVHTVDHLQNIIASLRVNPLIKNVERVLNSGLS